MNPLTSRKLVAIFTALSFAFLQAVPAGFAILQPPGTAIAGDSKYNFQVVRVGIDNKGTSAGTGTDTGSQGTNTTTDFLGDTLHLVRSTAPAQSSQAATVNIPGVTASLSTQLAVDLQVAVASNEVTFIYQNTEYRGTVNVNDTYTHGTLVGGLAVSDSVTRYLTLDFSNTGSESEPQWTFSSFGDKTVNDHPRFGTGITETVYTFTTLTEDPSVAILQSSRSTSVLSNTTVITYKPIYNDPANHALGIKQLATQSSVLSNPKGITKESYYAYDDAGNKTATVDVTPTSANYQISEAYADSDLVNNRTISATASGNLTGLSHSPEQAINVINQHVLMQTVVYFQDATKQFTVETAKNGDNDFSPRRVVMAASTGCEVALTTTIVQGEVDQLAKNSSDPKDIPIQNLQSVNGYDVFYGSYRNQHAFVNMPANAPSGYGLVFAKPPADAGLFRNKDYTDIVIVDYPRQQNMWLDGLYYSIKINDVTGAVTLEKEAPPAVSAFVSNLQTKLNSSQPNVFTVDENQQGNGISQIRIHRASASSRGELDLITFNVSVDSNNVVKVSSPSDARYSGFMTTGCNGGSSLVSGSMLFGALQQPPLSADPAQAIADMAKLSVQSVESNGAVRFILKDDAGNDRHYKAYWDGTNPKLEEELPPAVQAFITALNKSSLMTDYNFSPVSGSSLPNTTMFSLTGKYALPDPRGLADGRLATLIITLDNNTGAVVQIFRAKMIKYLPDGYEQVEISGQPLFDAIKDFFAISDLQALEKMGHLAVSSVENSGTPSEVIHFALKVNGEDKYYKAYRDGDQSKLEEEPSVIAEYQIGVEPGTSTRLFRDGTYEFNYGGKTYHSDENGAINFAGGWVIKITFGTQGELVGLTSSRNDGHVEMTFNKVGEKVYVSEVKEYNFWQGLFETIRYDAVAKKKSTTIYWTYEGTNYENTYVRYYSAVTDFTNYKLIVDPKNNIFSVDNYKTLGQSRVDLTYEGSKLTRWALNFEKDYPGQPEYYLAINSGLDLTESVLDGHPDRTLSSLQHLLQNDMFISNAKWPESVLKTSDGISATYAFIDYDPANPNLGGWYFTVGSSLTPLYTELDADGKVILQVGKKTYDVKVSDQGIVGLELRASAEVTQFASDLQTKLNQWGGGNNWYTVQKPVLQSDGTALITVVAEGLSLEHMTFKMDASGRLQMGFYTGTYKIGTVTKDLLDAMKSLLPEGTGDMDIVVQTARLNVYKVEGEGDNKVIHFQQPLENGISLWYQTTSAKPELELAPAVKEYRKSLEDKLNENGNFYQVKGTPQLDGHFLIEVTAQNLSLKRMSFVVDQNTNLIKETPVQAEYNGYGEVGQLLFDGMPQVQPGVTDHDALVLMARLKLSYYYVFSPNDVHQMLFESDGVFYRYDKTWDNQKIVKKTAAQLYKEQLVGMLGEGYNVVVTATPGLTNTHTLEVTHAGQRDGMLHSAKFSLNEFNPRLGYALDLVFDGKTLTNATTTMIYAKMYTTLPDYVHSLSAITIYGVDADGRGIHYLNSLDGKFYKLSWDGIVEEVPPPSEAVVNPFTVDLTLDPDGYNSATVQVKTGGGVTLTLADGTVLQGSYDPVTLMVGFTQDVFGDKSEIDTYVVKLTKKSGGGSSDYYVSKIEWREAFVSSQEGWVWESRFDESGNLDADHFGEMQIGLSGSEPMLWDTSNPAHKVPLTEPSLTHFLSYDYTQSIIDELKALLA